MRSMIVRVWTSTKDHSWRFFAGRSGPAARAFALGSVDTPGTAICRIELAVGAAFKTHAHSHHPPCCLRQGAP